MCVQNHCFQTKEIKHSSCPKIPAAPGLLPVAQLIAEFPRIGVGRPALKALRQLQRSLPVRALHASRERHLRGRVGGGPGSTVERNVSLDQILYGFCPQNGCHQIKNPIFRWTQFSDVPHLRTTPSQKKKKTTLSTYPRVFFHLRLSHQENTSPVSEVGSWSNKILQTQKKGHGGSSKPKSFHALLYLSCDRPCAFLRLPRF